MAIDVNRQIEAERLEEVRRYAVLDTPPDGAFDRICALAARFFDVPIATVSIVDEDRIWFKARLGLDAIELPRLPGLCASAIMQDGPYVVTDGLADPRTAANPLVSGAPGIRFYAAAPIVTSGGHRLGTVNVIDVRPRQATEAETDTLQDLAAIVMDELELRLAAMREIRAERERRLLSEEAKRHAEELTRTLKRSVSPASLPSIIGLDVAVRYEPFASERIGGDFYDCMALARDRTVFFLGDVRGHGPRAAAVTSVARYTMRAAAMQKVDPATVLARLNAALLLDGARSGAIESCTAVYGEIDTSDANVVVSLAVAGHPAPVVVRADGVVEMLAARGTILGAFADAAFGTCEIVLSPGDAIVVYSDGILDTTIDDLPMNEAGVARLLAGEAPATAQELVDRLGAALPRMDRVRDDVAIIAVGRTVEAGCR